MNYRLKNTEVKAWQRIGQSDEHWPEWFKYGNYCRVWRKNDDDDCLGVDLCWEIYDVEKGDWIISDKKDNWMTYTDKEFNELYERTA